MIKKKPFIDFKNPLVWGSAIVSLGIVFTFLTKIVDFCRIPEAVAATNKKVENVEVEVEDVKDYIKEQRMQNELMQKMVSHDKEKIFSPDHKKVWNEDTQKWERII